MKEGKQKGRVKYPFSGRMRAIQLKARLRKLGRLIFFYVCKADKVISAKKDVSNYVFCM